ncbi:MAG: type V CRISPR-associated protein Cas12a/Cpf1 [Patescibacteria group bacterium]
MDKTKKEPKAFSDFTNLYSLSKTLRFELKPVGKTQQILEKENVFAKDKLIQEKYQKTKPYFDRLHLEFIDEALRGVTLTGLDEYFEILKNWQKDKKNKEAQRAYKNKLQELRKEVVKKFGDKAEKWVNEIYTSVGLKNKDIEILFEEAVFDLLKARYGSETESIIEIEEKDKSGQTNIKQVSIFDSWKGFAGYFKKFFETRRNFYKDDGTSTALATRIIDQNLKRFCDNITLFESIKEKMDFKEVEKIFGVQLVQVFSLGFYNRRLLQDGINKYNIILGGETLENGEKRKGLNECINLHKQKTGEKLPFFKTLDKQILSDKASFLDGIKDETVLLKVLKQFAKTAEEKMKILQPLFTDFIAENDDYDLSQIYIEKKVFDPNSCRWIDKSAIDNFQEALYKEMKSEKLAKYEKKENAYKFPDFIALSYIKCALENGKFEGNFWKDKYYDIAGFAKKTNWEQFLTIFSFEFNSLFERTIKDEDGNEKQIGYNIFSQNFEFLIKKNPFTLSQEAKVIIKEFADSVLTIYQVAKYFAVEKKRAWLSEYELDSFYTHPETGYLRFYENAYEDIVQIYNDLRNYLTKKPYSEEKWKLNFECSYLLGGWSSEFETHGSLIFEKNGKYYLGVINGKALTKENRQRLAEGITEENKCFKMVYDFQKPDNKNVPRLFIRSNGENFSPAVKELDLPINTILDIYDQRLFKTENKNLPLFKDSLRKIIDYFKLGFSRHNSYKHFPFKWKGSSEYENIADFYQDTISSCYQLQWEGLNFHEIEKLTESKDLYLFQIYNKDFSDKSKGSKNLYSLYFQSLFLKENLENKDGVILKLSGGGEIFFRPKTDKGKLGERTDSKGKKVIKNKRYSEDKMFLHFPIELNYARGQEGNFNAKINNFLASNHDINIIGVDRGEKHLAYYSVINQKQEILESGSLNEITGINYADKLEEKAKNREQARKDWQTVEGIKDLKKGYISQVVRKLADLAIKHNAIIVFEDLNMRFKQIRGGIEKSAYQQLEKALIEKLNFLVQKVETNPEKAGHLLRAYQLTATFKTFKDMGKQTGIIFYTQAAYTSRIDPITGWRPHLYLKYSSAEKAKNDLLKFTKIEFVNGRFEFTYDIKNFQQAEEYPKNTVWTACSNVERFRWDKSLNQNKGGYTHYQNLTDGKTENKNPKSSKPDNLKELFTRYDIDISKDIKTQIEKLETNGNEKFFEHFMFFFNLICQIRNTDGNLHEKIERYKKEKRLKEVAEKELFDADFVLSPVEPFFDSRKAEQFGKNLPKNGDDNGAYNIARKGIIVLKKISQFAKEKGGCEKLSWGDLYVSATDWDDFTCDNQAT